MHRDTHTRTLLRAAASLHMTGSKLGATQGAVRVKLPAAVTLAHTTGSPQSTLRGAVY